jgi:fructan beta-fructosidase
MLGWMNNWQYANKVPTHPWRGQMTIPREVGLHTFPDGIRLVQKPIAAVKTSAFDPGRAHRAGWRIAAKDGTYTELGYDADRKEVYVDRTHSGNTGFSKDFPARTAAPYPAPSGPLSFNILMDRNSIEVFTTDGRVAITNLIFSPPADRVTFFSEPDKTAKEVHRLVP